MNDTESSNALSLEAKYSCQNCHKRKVKCDRGKPCTNCVKSSATCDYKPPPPPKRKRKHGQLELEEKLRIYELVLRKKGVQLDVDGNILDLDDALQSDSDLAPLSKKSLYDLKDPPSKKSLLSSKSEPKRGLCFRKEEGTLVSEAGKTRYLESNVWITIQESLPNSNSHNLLQDHVNRASDDDSSQSASQNQPNALLFGKTKGPDPIESFPRPEHVKILWKAFLSNVDPLIKMVHAPTVEEYIQLACQNVHSMTKTQLALLFAIFLSALTSLDDERAQSKLGQPRSFMFRKTALATERSFVRAGLLQTTDPTLLMAFIIYLFATRGGADSQITWTLVGVAVRCGQRIGLHKQDVGGLTPFEIEIRRRIWKQLLILDWASSELAGTSCLVQFVPQWWTTTGPNNLNDSDLYPQMTHAPTDRLEATEMIFCMLRCEFGTFFTAFKPCDEKLAPSLSEMDQYLDELEKTIEHKFIRFCDLINPLHTMVTVVSRAAICSMRIRAYTSIRDPESRKAVTEEDHKRIFRLSLKALQYDDFIIHNPSLKGFLWHCRDFFQFHPLIFLLVAIRTSMVGSQVEEAWQLISKVYNNRIELAAPRKSLQKAVGMLATQAWDAREAELIRLKQPVHVPSFIARLRSNVSTPMDKRAASLSSSHQARLNETVPVRPTLSNGSQSTGSLRNWDLNGQISPPVMNQCFELDPNAYWSQWDNFMVDPTFSTGLDPGMSFPFVSLDGHFQPLP